MRKVEFLLFSIILPFRAELALKRFKGTKRDDANSLSLTRTEETN